MIPNHVGIIVDGNGSWATNQGLKRSAGHKAGAKNLKKMIQHIFRKNVKILSLYIFSTENFKRDQEEVNYLMNLFIDYFKTELKEFNKNNIKVLFSGRKSNLNQKVLTAIETLENETKNNNLKILNFCLNYGSQYEIIDAVNNIIKKKVSDINIETFRKYLYQDLPDIDLLIRTGGETRLSNFMLWQLAYAELSFTNTKFPALSTNEVDEIFLTYQAKDRRFGGNRKESK